MDFRNITLVSGFPRSLVLPGGTTTYEIAGREADSRKPDGNQEVFAVTEAGRMRRDRPEEQSTNQERRFHWTERPLPDGSTALFPGEQPADYIGGQIQRVSADGSTVTTLYSECGGERLKGPNDLVFDREGNFYFTDHGKNRPRDRDRTGVFYASPDGTFIREIIFPMEAPNGIGLSPDEKTLYVAETPTGRLWAIDLVAQGQVGARRVVGTLPPGGPANLAMCDSLCVDGEGNIIVATLVNGGLTSFLPDGKTVTHYPCPDVLTTNACFGGPGLRTLYATLSTTGRLIAFDDWPTAGLRLNFQAA